MTYLKISKAALVACALGALLAGCGGGGSGSMPALPAGTQTQSVAVQFSITIPQSLSRMPKYISAGTQSAQITVTPTGGAALAPVTVNCTTTCSGTVQAPVGSDNFSVSLFDQPAAAGNVLSKGATTQTIVAGQANSVNLTFNGVVKTIALSGPSAITLGTVSSSALTVVAKDAATRTIVGGYDNPITLGAADTSNSVTLSKSTLAASTDTANLVYNGSNSFVQVSVTATASAAISATPLAIHSIAAPTVAGGVVFLASGAGAINASSTQATIAALSEYAIAIDSSKTLLPTGSATLQVGTNLNPLDFGRQIQASGAQTSSSDEAWNGHSRDLPVESNSQVRARLSGLTPAAPSAPGRTLKSITLPTLGSVQNFNIVAAAIDGSGTSVNNSVPFKLAAISNHGLIWLDNTLSSTVMGYGTQIGQIFDNAYASDTANFGSADYTASSAGYLDTSATGNNPTYSTCDAAGNPVPGVNVPLMIAPATPGYINVLIVNGANPSLGSGVGGYFDQSNYYNQGVINCVKPYGSWISNQMPQIVMGWFSNGTSSTTQGDPYALNEDLVRGTSHELQHLINFINHAMISDQADNDPRWLNEGMSVLAQDLATTGGFDVNDALSHGAAYLTHPQENSITGFQRVGASIPGGVAYNCSSCYGGSYLFARYMYDRFGGGAFTRAMTTGPNYGHASLLAISGYGNLGALLGDFGTALAVSNTGLSTDPRYNFGSGGANNLNLHHTYTPTTGVGVSATLNGPAMLSAITPGITYTITNMPAGALAFFNVTSLSSAGSAVKLVDTTGSGSAMSFAGSIAQK